MAANYAGSMFMCATAERNTSSYVSVSDLRGFVLSRRQPSSIANSLRSRNHIAGCQHVHISIHQLRRGTRIWCELTVTCRPTLSRHHCVYTHMWGTLRGSTNTCMWIVHALLQAEDGQIWPTSLFSVRILVSRYRKQQIFSLSRCKLVILCYCGCQVLTV